MMLLSIMVCAILATVNSQYNHQCCRLFNFPAQCHFRQSLYYGAPTSSNYISGSRYVKWMSYPNNPSGTHGCRRQGVLRVHPGVGSQMARKVHVYLGICNPTKYTFNVGDSTTNNGWGGGNYGTTPWCAEIHNYYTRMYAYENVAWKRTGPPVALNHLPHYFNSYGSTTWHLEMDKCNKVRMSTSPPIRGTDFTMNNDQMFRYDEFYVGLNRVVYTGWPWGRLGAGVCEVCIRFDSPLSTPCRTPAGYGYCSCQAPMNPILLASAARLSAAQQQLKSKVMEDVPTDARGASVVAAARPAAEAAPARS